MADNEYNSDLCKFKHSEIEKDFTHIREDLKVFLDKKEKQDEVLRVDMTKLLEDAKDGITDSIKESQRTLKDKIIVTSNRTGVQIDTLTEFNKELKGNGRPSVNEKVRTLKCHIRFLYGIITIMIILLLGGNHMGVTLRGIDNFLFGKPKVQQVDPNQPSDLSILNIYRDSNSIE